MTNEQIEAVRSYLMDLECPIPEDDANAVCDLALKALTLQQGALDKAAFELQRHFGREGSIYGIKACEEIARIAIVAYQCGVTRP